MSEREPLVEWLHRAAARARSASRLRETAFLVCLLLALLALHQGLRLLVSTAEVLAAVLPFFFLAAIGAAAVCAVRLWRAPTLAQAAAVADARAGLKDELRSALWFAQHGGGGPLTGLLLARASRTVQTLDVRRLFPLALSPRVTCALGLALAAVALTRPDPGGMEGLPAAAQPGAAAPVGGRAPLHDASEQTARFDSPAATVSGRAGGLWAELEELASALADDVQSQAIGQAIAAHDAAYAARMLEALQRRRAAETNPAAVARPDAEQMSDALAQAILERLQEVLKEQARADQTTRASSEPLLSHLAEQLREDSEVQKGDPAGQQSAGETALNAALRAINRSSIGQRDVLGASGAAGEEAGRTSIGGGAMGRRIGTSRAGAGEDQRPQADPAGDAEAEPVLGLKTQRLQAQLQRIEVEPSPEPEQPGAEQSLYAETRAQSARSAYQAVAASAHPGTEGLASGERLPLAYRDAARRYTLGQHRDLHEAGLGTRE